MWKGYLFIYLKDKENIQVEDCLGIANVSYLIFGHISLITVPPKHL